MHIMYLDARDDATGSFRLGGHLTFAVPLLVVCSLLLLPGSLLGGDCSREIGVTPAFGADADLWGALQPTDTGQLPADRDTTDYDGGQAHDCRYPLFTSVDVENGYAFTSYWYGFHVWDARGSKAGDPVLLATRDQARLACGGGFLHGIGYQEERWLMRDLDAPPGVDSLLAVGGKALGVTFWDTSKKSDPHQLYQDTGKFPRQVYTATIGGTHYTFAAVNGGGPGAKGLHVYDGSAAATLYGSSSGCLENSNSGATCGVYRSRIGGDDPAQYVDGFRGSGGEHYIAFSPGGGPGYPKGVALYEVTNPLLPADLLGGQRLFDDEFVFGVATWRDGSDAYLALHAFNPNLNQWSMRIHDIGACLDGSCTESEVPAVWSQVAPYLNGNHWVTYSNSVGEESQTGTRYLYWGVESGCGDGSAREFLHDVTNIDTQGPVEITPTATITEGGEEIDYWSWYYHENPTGFRLVVPRVGKFAGNHFFRAAYTLFDVHERVNADPTIDVTGPDQTYGGQTTTFSASASNCTPETGSWSWTVDGGTIEAGGSGSSIDVSWSPSSYPVLRTVTAENPGCSGAVGSHAVEVLDPAPAIGSAISDSPATKVKCGQITFGASGITGKPALTCAWAILDEQKAIRGSRTANCDDGDDTFQWNPDVTVEPGAYTVELTVSNDVSSATKQKAFTIEPLPTLAFTDDATPSATPNPTENGTVELSIADEDQGATEWCWDYEGDGAFVCSFDPDAAGPFNHTYSQGDVEQFCPDNDNDGSGDLPCTFDVVVQIANCEAGPLTSQPRAVTVNALEPLVADFQAQCQFAPCSFTVGDPITFVDQSSGNPDTWDYDWNGDGTFEDAGHTSPVTSHTYNATGTYSPKLRVNRGSETDVFTHSAFSVGSPAPPPSPSISVSGPSSGDIGEVLTFSARASDCTPSSSGWVWSVDGGTVNGAANGSSINVSWGSSGTKRMTAKNSACGSAVGSKSVSIGSSSAPPPSGGNCGSSEDGVTACFTISPSAPETGTAVTFDASSSKGSIKSYEWDFGDGTSGSGVTTSHTYSKSGSYKVTLTATTGGLCGFEACGATHTRTVTVSKDGGSDTGDGSCGNPTESGLEACFSFDPEAPSTHETVTFDASESGGDPASYTWDFGDGSPEATGVTAAHTFTAPGTYDVTLEVTQNKVCGFDKCRARTVREVVVVASPAGALCEKSTGTLCLRDEGRFNIRVNWTKSDGEKGSGTAVDIGKRDSGLFWFFGKNNIEMLVKVVKGCELTDHWWVFAGATTNQEFTLEVEDRKTGYIKRYHNPQGQVPEPIQDLYAIPCSDEGEPETVVETIAEADRLESVAITSTPPTGTASSCVAGPETLCLGKDDRFQVRLDWEKESGETGVGKIVPLDRLQSGLFYFFREDNVEMQVKVLDGCTTQFESFWVFYAATTNVGFDLTVADTQTGATRTYSNEVGRAAPPVLDVAAFACE